MPNEINHCTIFTMSKLQACCLLLLLLLNLTTAVIVIDSVANDQEFKDIPAESSVNGGKVVYISVTGHSQVPSENQISLVDDRGVERATCSIGDGVWPSYLNCITDPISDPSYYNVRLRVKLSSNGETALSSSPHYVYYKTSTTPYLNDIFPSVGYRGSTTHFYGVHKIRDLGDGQRDMGDVQALKIGDENCDRFDLTQEAHSNPWSNNYLHCIQSIFGEAGHVNVSELLEPYGYAQHHYRLKRASLNAADSYEFTVLPSVKDIDVNRGNSFGNFIRIEGGGFSRTAAENKIMIDNTPCTPIESSENWLYCLLSAQVTGLNSNLSTNASAQVDGYEQGSGMRYTRHAYTSSFDSYITAARAGTPTVREDGYRGEIREANVYGSYYGQYWRGYFNATADGEYVFRAWADDRVAVYLAQDYGTAEIPADAEPLLRSSAAGYFNDYYEATYGGAEGKRTLMAGKRYYMEVFHINWSGPGFMKLEVEVPTTGNSFTHQVDKIQVAAEIQPEVRYFRMSKGDPSVDKWRLYIFRLNKNNPAKSYDVQRNISYDCSASTLRSALVKFDIYKSSYGITVTKTYLDASGNEVPDEANCSSIEYSVSILLMRSSSHRNQEVDIESYGSATLTTGLQMSHSPLIDGQWQLTYSNVENGNPVTQTKAFGEGVSASTVRDWIRGRFSGYFAHVEVYRSTTHGCSYGCTWTINYKQVPGSVASFTPVIGSLTGGKNTPTISLSNIRPFSSSQLFHPIDHNFLSMASTNPGIIVTVNNLRSICIGNCSYEFATLGQITALSRAGTTLTISLSDPAALNFTSSDVSVKVNGQVCVVDTASPSVAPLTCTMASNADGSPIMIADEVTPLVYVKNVGIMGRAVGVNALTATLTATAATATLDGNNGGYPVTVTGTGFPLDKKNITVTVCGTEADITSVSNVEVIFILPAACSSETGATTISINTTRSVSTVTTSFTLTDSALSAPKVSSLTPNSANPGVKGVVQIQGTNFDTDRTKLTVTLRQSGMVKYTLKVLNSTATQIFAGLPGGVNGTFTLVVRVDGKGDSLPATAGADTFDYEVVITSVSPTSGGHYGGTVLTITGRNFATDIQQTLVFIGDQLNQFCEIDELTATQIKCRTPRMHQWDIDDNETIQKVVVTTRLVQLSECEGTCTFQYADASASPNLTSISKSSLSSGAITLEGHGLNDASCEVLLTDKADKTKMYTLTASVCTPTSVETSINTGTDIVSGNYLVQVKTLSGNTNGLNLQVDWGVGTLTSGTSTSGSFVKIQSAKGWPSSIDGTKFKIEVSSPSRTYLLDLVSCCSGGNAEIKLPATTTDETFTINFVGPVNTVTQTVSVAGSSTQTVTLDTAMPITAGAITLTVSVVNGASYPISDLMLTSTTNKHHKVHATNIVASGDSTSFDVTLDAGAYHIVARSGNNIFFCSDKVNVGYVSAPTASSIPVSFNGGNITITGSNISPASYITVNHNRGAYITGDASSAIFEVPALVTADTQSMFGLVQPVSLLDSSQFTLFSDTDSPGPSNSADAFDGSLRTNYDSANTDCFIGVDVGTGKQASVARIKFFPSIEWKSNVIKKVLEGKFQGSNDMNDPASWMDLVTIDQTVQTGWNTYLSAESTPYRYIRFVHSNTSRCNLAEIEFYGIVQNSLAVHLAGQSSDVILHDGFNSQTLASAVTYQQPSTPIIDAVNPPYGEIFGEYELTLSGRNLNTSDASTDAEVIIDGVLCENPTPVDATSFKCTVKPRLSPPKKNSFTVKIGHNKALIKESFLYVLKWSNPDSWGTDLPPIQNDLVFIPEGQALLVDEDTPKLQGIAAQNATIIFPDDKDLTVQAGFITLKNGRFLAGTEAKPHTHKLTFIMYGDYYGKQQPDLGNKGIGCMGCDFNMHGVVRTPTWTSIAATVNPGDTTVTLIEAVDWKVGEEIVIASTSFERTESESFKITAISADMMTLTLNTSAVYKHILEIEHYGQNGRQHTLQMRAEVGLLTRNIVVKGDDDHSVAHKYGSHLLIMNSRWQKAQGKVAYSEFTQCGQPKIMGRYCIHFHLMGDIPTSYSRGNAVHHSFARLTTIHGVHYATVEKNVGYQISGHNIFVEDGIETNNMIRDNLIISATAVTNMMQTDTSVAAIWVTHPTNHVIGNHVVGSEFYGFWYEIKSKPDGPSATSGVCGVGNPIGTVANNTAHSNTRFGLRLFKMFARKYPCDPIRTTDAIDPWAANPSIKQTFINFTIYKNKERGVLSEDTGNVFFQNFTIAENLKAGIQFFISNFTKEPPGIVNSAIVGISRTNQDPDSSRYSSMTTILTGRSGPTTIKEVDIYNYPSTSTVLKTCSHCNDPLIYTNRGTDVFIESVTLNNVTGKYLEMLGLNRDVIYIKDSSFSAEFDSNTTRTNSTIVRNFPHIYAYNPVLCPKPTDSSKWDNTLMCDSNTHLRRVQFTNMQKHRQFEVMWLKAAETAYDTFLPHQMDSSNYTSIYHRLPGTSMNSGDKAYGWSMPYIAGKTYQIWWGTGVDWTHMAVESNEYPGWMDGIIFKFNNTEQREFYKVSHRRAGSLHKNQTALGISQAPTGENTIAQLDPATCKDGDMTNNFTTNVTFWQTMTLCLSGKGTRTPFQYTEVDGVMCKYFCPVAEETSFLPESFVRRWSVDEDWRKKPNCVSSSTCGDNGAEITDFMAWGGAMPAMPASPRKPLAGQNVYIHGNYTYILDQDIEVNNLTIDGRIFIPSDATVTITARFIHLRSTSAEIKTEQRLEESASLTIRMIGDKFSGSYTVDPGLGSSKLFAVSGKLTLLGHKPATIHTHLKAYATKGDTSIRVGATSGWKAGDELAISPSFGKRTQYEKVTIASVSGDTVTLTAPLEYDHFGATSQTLDTPLGKIDTRSRVGHLTRNVRIEAGNDVGWGYTMFVYQYFQINREDLSKSLWRKGSATIDGVQFIDGGQLDSTKSPLVVKNTQLATSIVDSSFMNCKAYCSQIDNAAEVTFDQNVFYNAWVFGVEVESQTTLATFTFENNLIIGVTERPTVPGGQQLVACFATYKYLNPADPISIQNNYCYGSVHGFALPHVGCTQLDSHKMKGNIVGSSSIGFILNAIGGSCQGFSHATAFQCGIGQIMGPPGKNSLRLSNFLMAENGRSVTLKIGSGEGGNEHTAYFSDSYITAISRPDCSQCYTNSNRCKGSQGLRLFSASGNGQKMPSKFGGGFDVICKQEVFSAKAYLYNVTFDNFRQNYTNANYKDACGKNFVFRPHGGAVDQTGGHNLYDCNCNNCDNNSYVKCDRPSPSGIGWFGGCGDIHCTGKINYMVQDHTGGFLGFRGAVVPNGDFSNNQQNCTYSSVMNGSVCSRDDFGILEYQNVDHDKQSRIMWPVDLKYFKDDGTFSYSTLTNGWKEWAWFGSEPLNRRLGRFISLIRNNRMYNMTYTASPPGKLQLQLQRRSQQGDPNTHVVIQLHYPFPNMIQVKRHIQVTNSRGQVVNRKRVVRPILLTDSGFKKPLNLTQCGSNLYDFRNYTVTFVVTEELGCLLEVSLKASIQLTTHFAISPSEFYNSDSHQTNFINNLAALLAIQDTSRIKIVGVLDGSTIVTTQISDVDPDSADVAEGTTDTSLDQINTLLIAVNSDPAQIAQLGSGVGTVLQTSSIYNSDPFTTTDSTGTSNSDGSSVGLYVGVAVAGLALLILGFLTFMYFYRRRAKISGDVMTQDTIQEDKDKNPSGLFGQGSQQEGPSDSDFKIKQNKLKIIDLQSQQFE